MSKISDEDVLKLAQLSKISLDDAHVHQFRAELEEILNYVEQLADVDVSGLEPTNQVTGLQSVMRDDEVNTFTSTEKLLKNLPGRDGNNIKVRKVL